MRDLFRQLAANRYSVRSYRPDPVETGLVEKCLETARLAPSACNAQPWKFVVVDDPVLKNKLAAETSDRILPLNHFTHQAPVIVAIVAEKGNVTSRLGQALKDRDFPWLDVGIAAAHFCLQATELGLGTCMIGWFHEKKSEGIAWNSIVQKGCPPHHPGLPGIGYRSSKEEKSPAAHRKF